jgi:hypothetical protein
MRRNNKLLTMIKNQVNAKPSQNDIFYKKDTSSMKYYKFQYNHPYGYVESYNNNSLYLKELFNTPNGDSPNVLEVSQKFGLNKIKWFNSDIDEDGMLLAFLTNDNKLIYLLDYDNDDYDDPEGNLFYNKFNAYGYISLRLFVNIEYGYDNKFVFNLELFTYDDDNICTSRIIVNNIYNNTVIKNITIDENGETSSFFTGHNINIEKLLKNIRLFDLRSKMDKYVYETIERAHEHFESEF